jgi:hypothetical protein
VGGLVIYKHIQTQRAALYAAAHQDSLEDFDVIAALDQLEDHSRI